MKTRKSMLVAALALASSAWLMQSQAQNITITGSLPGGLGYEAPSTGATPLVATLEMVKPELQQLRLTIENRGNSTVRVLRLRPGWLEYSAGSLHDWQIRIEGPGGYYQFPFYTGLVAVPAEKDFIELAPGEAFALLIKVSEATRHGGGKEYHLPQTTGSYTVTISHGALRSNTLKFTVGELQGLRVPATGGGIARGEVPQVALQFGGYNGDPANPATLTFDIISSWRSHTLRLGETVPGTYFKLTKFEADGLKLTVTNTVTNAAAVLTLPKPIPT